MIKNIINPEAGKYILAVSGGVDSVVLLDILTKNRIKQRYDLIVAHYNHGIRSDSSKDEKLVKDLATSYELEFVSAQGNLGENTSEAKARASRYQFLRKICKKYNAEKIITAHHLDDRIETVLFNLQRGTGRRGLVPFSKNSDIIRPLKNVSKREILRYADKHNLKWREDSSNKDLKYSRNTIRHKLLPELESTNPDFRNHFAHLLNELEKDNKKIDELLENKLNAIGTKQDNSVVLKREGLISMKQNILREFLYFCVLKLDPSAEVLSPQIVRLAHYCKTARPGTTCPINSDILAKATINTITLIKIGRKA